MEQIELSASLIIERAWQYAKTSNGIIMCVIFFVYIIVANSIGNFFVDSSVLNDPALMADPIALWRALAPGMGVATLVSIILNAIFHFGFYRSMLGLVKEEYAEPTVEAWKASIDTYVKFVAVDILVVLALSVGFGCCIIPGIFLAVRLVWAPLYILENPNASIGEAFSASWNMSSNNFGELLLTGVLAILVGLSGIIACCVGVYFTAIIAYFAWVITYLTIKRNL